MMHHSLNDSAARNAEIFLSPRQAAKILGITSEAVKQYIYLGRLPALKQSNGFWKIRKSDFELFLRTRTTLPPETIMVFPAGEAKDSIVAGIRSGRRAELFASTQREALQLLQSAHPVAVVVDLSDRVAGWKFIMALRRIRNSGALPLLLVSYAPLSEDELSQALAVRASAVLTAPLTQDGFNAELTCVFRHKQQTR